MTSKFFFFNDTATTEIYTLSLHDALPISGGPGRGVEGPGAGAVAAVRQRQRGRPRVARGDRRAPPGRSEEHTSELQSRQYLVCRLLLEKKQHLRLYYLTLTLLNSVFAIFS